MLILVPWKPVVFIWLLLSAMLFVGFIASSLMDGWNPFVPRMLQRHETHHAGHAVLHHHKSVRRPA
jgi:hypothetical protein